MRTYHLEVFIDSAVLYLRETEEKNKFLKISDAIRC
jgi:hypothetical protein